MTPNEVAAIIAECQSPGMTFKVQSLTRDHIDSDPYYLQVEFDAPEDEQSWTGVRPPVTQRGRKWLLSEHMTRNEIVQTCFLAVMTVMEHEVREGFRYRGRKIFNPHFDPDALWILARGKQNLDLRPEPAVQADGTIKVHDGLPDTSR